MKENKIYRQKTICNTIGNRQDSNREPYSENYQPPKGQNFRKIAEIPTENRTYLSQEQKYKIPAKIWNYRRNIGNKVLNFSKIHANICISKIHFSKTEPSTFKLCLTYIISLKKIRLRKRDTNVWELQHELKSHLKYSRTERRRKKWFSITEQGKAK